MRIAGDGSLLISTAKGTVRELPPIAYQTRAGERVPVEARFELYDDGASGFALGAYAGERHVSLFAACFEAGLREHVPERGAEKLHEFAAWISRMAEHAENGPAAEVVPVSAGRATG